MRILIAPQEFKETLTAGQAAEAIVVGLRRVWPAADYDPLPLADGGGGTVHALVEGQGGEYRETLVTGPLAEPVLARWGIVGRPATAIIEMSAASGLALVPPERRDPRITTTRGTGELLRAALDAGCRSILIGIGGSATNDAGAGMAEALGARLLDTEGRPLPPGGLALGRLARIVPDGLDPRLAEADVRVACDVDNPLCGPRGASAVYGPQKGADPALVEALDAALAHFAEVARRDLGRDVRDLPGAGAAGGLGAGLVLFAHARLQPGFELIAEVVGLRDRLTRSDLVITGEGQLDGQSWQGKTTGSLAKMAAGLGLPVVVIAGSLADDHAAMYQRGVAAALGVPGRPITFAELRGQPAEALQDAAERAARLMAVGQRLTERESAGPAGLALPPAQRQD